MSLEELVEYFDGQYTKTQIIAALEKIKAVPDEKGQYYNGVAQGLETAFVISQEAVKQLPGANIQEAQNLAIQLAEEQAIALNLDGNTP